MADRLTLAEVEAVAALARIELTDDEKQLFQRQLSEILDAARQIGALDTSGVEPTAHALAPDTVVRDDVEYPSLPRGDVLANAPDADLDAGLFRVPRVIGG